MLLTAVLFAALGVVAFGLRAPFQPARAAKAAAGGLALGVVLAYLNAYPGSVRGALLLLALALLVSGLVVGNPYRPGARPLFPRAPIVGGALALALVLGGLFPYTAWGAESVEEPLYGDLNSNVVKTDAPALADAADVRVVPWELASQLLVRAYGEDASFLDVSPTLLTRNTFPDTVNGEFVWVHAPAPETAKWLVGRLADKVVYVKNDATDLTPSVVRGTLNVHLDSIWWQDRLAAYARDDAELRYVMEDYALQLDDDYRPHWVGYLARLDLRNQPHLERLLIVDAQTGEERLVPLDEAPEWLEIVYPERYVYEWASYWGTHREGVLYRWFNATRLVQPDDMTVRYIRLEDKTYWLLPMVQMTSSQLGGYVLVDTRTGEATFYDRFEDSLVDYDTALRQLRAIMASGEATQGGGAIQLQVSEGYLYPIRMNDGTVREAYVFPLLEALKLSRFAIIDAHDYTTKRVFAPSIGDALRSFAAETDDTGNATQHVARLVRVVDGAVSDGKALVNLSGVHYRVTPSDLALGERAEAAREFDELELAIARANRGEPVELEVLLHGGRVLDVRYPGLTWGG